MFTLRNVSDSFDKSVVLGWANSKSCFYCFNLVRENIFSPESDVFHFITKVLVLFDQIIGQKER